MATDQALLGAVRDYVSPLGEIVEKRIVKGIGFMWRGNLLCSVSADRLLVRVDATDYEDWVQSNGAQPMIMGARTAKGWIYIDHSVASTDDGLRTWLDRAVRYSRNLPKK